jgi:RNA polymerase sigma-70 factor (ECF subfamily)
MKKLNEEEIIPLLQDKQQRHNAFSKVVRAYQEALYWHVRKMVLNHEDANDILQNVFLKTWSGIDGFRGESKISTWLFRIAVNETLTFLNKQRINNLTTAVDLEDLLLKNLQSDSYFDGDEWQMKLQKAILTLPEKQRLVFNMKYFDGLKYEEMEQVLGTSVGALKTSYHIATKKVEKYLLEED